MNFDLGLNRIFLASPVLSFVLLGMVHLRPAGTYWVGADGNDANPCTQELPCASIGYVLQTLAGDGDVVKVLPGIYREQIEISQGELTLEGVGAGVFIYGSEMPLLQEEDGLYTADWQWGTSFAGTNFCTNLTNDVALGEWACNTLGFWQDGIRLEQVASKSEVTAGSFYHDFDDGRVWLLPAVGNETLEGIEGLAHPYVVKLAPESEGVTLKNFQIWYGASMPDEGILHIEGAGHSIADVGVRYSAGAGVDVYGADQVTIENVEAAEHGQNGWRIHADASFSTTTGWEINDRVDDLYVSNSISRDNGWKAYDNCWGGGGTKFSFTNNLVVEGFYSADNNGFGIWLDIENHGYAIRHSMSARDSGRGIFVEYISDDGVVENNVIFGTRDADAIGCGVSVGLAAADSRNVVLKNNTVYSTEDDVKGLMLKTGCPTCRSFPYPSEFITWENNLLVNKDAAGFVRDLDDGSADPFTYLDTAIEEEFTGDGTVFVCWDALGDCSSAALGIETLAQGNYLADPSSECGFEVIYDLASGRGAQAFVHPQAEEICGVPAPALPPTADFTFSIDGFTVSFNDASFDDVSIVNRAWEFGDGETSTEQHPSHTYSAAGAYEVSLTVTDDEGLQDVATQTVVVEEEVSTPAPPQAGFDSEVEALSVTFTDTSTDDGQIASWFWEFGDGATSSDQHPAHVYAAAGTYTVSLTVTDDENLSDTFTSEVSVIEEAQAQPPVANFSVDVDAFTANFTDLSVDEDGVIESWVWDFGDGQTDTLQHPVHVYTDAGVYSISLEVTDNSGLTDSHSASMEITQVEEDEGAFIEENGFLIMEAEHYTGWYTNLETSDAWLLQESELDGESVASMQALPDDGHIIQLDFSVDNAEINFPIVINSTGTFYVWLRANMQVDGSTVFVGCDDQSMRMGVSAAQAAATAWDWYGMKNGGRRAQFTVSEPGENTFHIWMREDGISIDRIVLTTDAEYVPEGVGPAESQRTGIFAATERGSSFSDVPARAVFNVLPERFSVASYPNPATNTVNLSVDLPRAGDLYGWIYDLLGRPVRPIRRNPFTEGKNHLIRLDVSNLPAGVYAYRLVFESHREIEAFYETFVLMGAR